MIAGHSCLSALMHSCTLRFLHHAGELALEAGLPPGVLNIITGNGPDAGAPLVSHRGVDKVCVECMCLVFWGRSFMMYVLLPLMT